MTSEHTRPGCAFWLWWVLANTIALPISSLIIALASKPMESLFVGQPLDRAFTEWPIMIAIVLPFAVSGGFFGLLQWLVLRRQSYRAIWWILAALVGFAIWVVSGVLLLIVFSNAVYAALGLILDHPEYERWLSILNVTLTGASFGFSVGIPQALTLRKGLRPASEWLFANTAGYAIGFVISSFFSLDSTNCVIVCSISSLPLAGAVAGAITGVVLIRILRISGSEMVA